MPDPRYLEAAVTVRDLVHYSTETKKLYALFCRLLREEAAVQRTVAFAPNRTPLYDENGSISGYRAESVDERHSRFDRVSGQIDGLEWMESEIEHLIRVANDHEPNGQVQPDEVA